jgi:ribonuclease BN (tRNA processing enzyme)
VPPWPGTEHPARPRLIVPEGATETFRRIVGSWGNEDLIEEAFAIEEYRSSSRPDVGELRLRFAEVPHFTETFAVEISGGGARFTFGADCRPGEEIVEFARDTDLLIIEATLPRPERTGVRGHLTPAEAGDHARRAGAKRVVITHISDELDEVWARKQASDAFGAPVEVASGGASYEV